MTCFLIEHLKYELLVTQHTVMSYSDIVYRTVIRSHQLITMADNCSEDGQLLSCQCLKMTTLSIQETWEATNVS